MFDERTYRLLRALSQKCADTDFYRRYRDLCIAAKIAELNVRGRGIVLRPSLLRPSNLSDAKAISNLLKKLKKTIGVVTDSIVLKHAAVEYIYKRLEELV
jgi:hypothetical protein